MVDEPKVTRKKITDYLPDDFNANAGTERGTRVIEDSLRTYGAGRSLLADKNGRLIAGNKTQQGAVDIGLEDVIEIETDGNQIVVVKRRDLSLDDAKARALAIADNRANEVSLNWDEPVLTALLADIAAKDKTMLQGTGFNAPEIEGLIDSMEDSGEDIPLTRYDVPDALWPTDNDYEIPLLDENMQADAVDLPLSIWGAGKRKARMNGTWAFYTDDYRFEALWDDPSDVVNTQCVNVVEPNFTTTQQMPFPVCLYNIYRKRWLARWWQSMGLRVFVDLNVHPKLYETNLLGVPQGWKAYATRGYSAQLDLLEREYELAKQHAGGGTLLFFVYGGGKTVRDYCRAHGLVWFDEVMNHGG